jgi:hypothetical protein
LQEGLEVHHLAFDQRWSVSHRTPKPAFARLDISETFEVLQGLTSRGRR